MTTRRTTERRKDARRQSAELPQEFKREPKIRRTRRTRRYHDRRQP